MHERGATCQLLYGPRIGQIHFFLTVILGLPGGYGVDGAHNARPSFLPGLMAGTVTPVLTVSTRIPFEHVKR